eukprot:TRINITY_DN24311_c0_g1_i1.p1 TRINITY_DN24311_c0_g1~~TRINITY_DN24311_c0_g1_i1.p1  ORF type:complete len:409 (-),score=58.06 TRINITY_DN24311_c0_g1_i1:15-1241(-)
MATHRSRRPRNLPKLDLSDAKKIDSADLSGNAQFKDLYDWQCVLGSGRTSLVRRAARRSDGQEVALKCSIEGADDALRSTLQSEFELMKAFAHDTILTAFELHAMPHSVWICLELCCDGCLESYMSKNCPFAETSAKPLGKQLLHGLAYLHTLRIVHRDVKPANLLLKDRGETLKIGDFGSAKEIGKRERASAMLSDRGSSLYSAPELRLDLDWNERVDVWSAGLCMYFMTQAALPAFLSNPDTKAWVTHGELPDLQFHDQLSSAWKLLLTECLKVDPKERPPAIQLLQHQSIRRANRNADPNKFSSEAASTGEHAAWTESRCGWTSFREVSERNSARHVANRPVQECTARAQARQAVTRACLRWAQQHDQAVSCLPVSPPCSEKKWRGRRFTTGLFHDFDRLVDLID